jgi:nitrous oxidase accessory protein NosD
MLAVAGLAMVPAPALAAHVACGDTITQDTTLDSDLLDCPGNGVHLDGDGITLDLGGHVIDGTRRGLGILAFGTSGTVVRGGRVTEFHDAIALGGAAEPVVRDMELAGSHDGILLTGGRGALVERVLAWGHDGSGVNMPFVRNALVRDNVMVGNAAAVSAFGQTASRFEHNVFGWSEFHGMRFAALADTVVTQNRLPGNGAYGIRLEDGSEGNLLTRTHVVGSSGDGISLGEDSGSNRLERNHSSRNGGDGFDIAGAGAALVRNHADANGGLGFDAPLGVAFDLLNKARRNGDPRQCVGVGCGRWMGP